MKGKTTFYSFICFSLLAYFAIADNVDCSGECGETVSWSYSAATRILTINGTGSMTEFEDNEDVPWCDVRAFIKKAVVKDGVTSLGNWSFSYCVSLQSVEIAPTVTLIGDYCFVRCFDLASVDIPSNVTTIGMSAFYYCTSLTAIVIPENVTSIGEDAFYYCNNLKSITLPMNVTTIEYGTFGGCSSLETVNLPPNVTSIGMFAFENCVSLSSIELPENLESIQLGAFLGCSSLNDVVLPSGLQEIGGYAFSGCFSLESITIPKGVETIEERVFSGCSSLANVMISEGVTKIDDYAFLGCNFTEIMIPKTVQEIGLVVFSFCDNLISIQVHPENDALMSVDGVLFQREGMVLLEFPRGKEGDYDIPDSATSIREYAFQTSQKLTSVSIPGSVEDIGFSPFDSCTSLASIKVSKSNTHFKSENDVLFTYDGTTLIQYPCRSNTRYSLPLSVETIQEGAFAGCADLEDVIISSTVSSIGDSAFEDCESLKSITIPSNVSSIGLCAFSGCTNLARISVAEGNPSYRDMDGVLFDKEEKTLIQYPCGHSSSYAVPNGVTCIGECAFYKCSGISSIKIPASVTTIQDYAFNTVNMAYVDFLGSVEPNCSESENAEYVITTFVDVDVVCVPLNYSSNYFCGKYKVKVDSCEKFVGQHNQCFEVLEWQAEEITVKKRANATLWEKRSNNCFEYQCLNESGGIAWSRCNSTGDVHRMCIENKCVEGDDIYREDKFTVEMYIDIPPSEYDVANLTLVLMNVSGVQNFELSVVTEATQQTGNVVRIVLYISDETVANSVVSLVETKGDDCEGYGVLCLAKGARIVTKQELSLSGAYIIHYNLLVFMILTIISVIVFK